jgi:clan AA aspartic protease (TIGR02281 family)
MRRLPALAAAQSVASGERQPDGRQGAAADRRPAADAGRGRHGVGREGDPRHRQRNGGRGRRQTPDAAVGWRTGQPRRRGPAPAAARRSCWRPARAATSSPAAAINGRAVSFLVDTGATTIAMSESDAARIGLDYAQRPARPEQHRQRHGAGVDASRSTSVRVGDVDGHNVDAVVMPAQHGCAAGQQLPVALPDEARERRHAAGIPPLRGAGAAGVSPLGRSGSNDRADNVGRGRALPGATETSRWT